MLELKKLIASPNPLLLETQALSLQSGDDDEPVGVIAERTSPEEIGNWSLFGKFIDPSLKRAVVAPVPKKTKPAEPTKLSLELEGVVFGNQPEVSKAMITHKGKLDQYAVGEKLPLPGNVSINSVQVDRVIIDNDGKLEALLLYTESLTEFNKQDSVDFASESVSIEEGVNDIFSSSDNEAETVLSDVFSFSMSRENGVLRGFKVDSVRPEKGADSFGISPGDLVVGVDDIMLDTPQKGLELFEIIRDRSSASFLIQRGGEQSVVNVSVGRNG